MAIAPEPTSYTAGDVVGGKYQLTRILGEGGMGQVWVARNNTLDVEVALKLIRREIAAAEASTRLLQEARTAARLGHPSIVRVFDYGISERGDPYIVMELLRGESLGDLLARKRRLRAVDAVRTLLPVASALVAAHAEGIVHRDLKPDNVFLVEDGDGDVLPKVVDFGIAKFNQAPEAQRVTLTGAIVGSPDYMSPEQARGKHDLIDERTDIWALCVVLYEAMTGSRPFPGDNYNAQLSSILLDDPVPITDLAAGDAELWAILQRGLAKDAAVRWPTMKSLAAALAEWAVARDVTTDIAGTTLLRYSQTKVSRRPFSEGSSRDSEGDQVADGLRSLRAHALQAQSAAAETSASAQPAPAPPASTTPAASLPPTSQSMPAVADPALAGQASTSATMSAPMAETPAPPVRRRSRGLVVAVAVLLLVGVLAFRFRPPRAPPDGPSPEATAAAVPPPVAAPSVAPPEPAPAEAAPVAPSATQTAAAASATATAATTKPAPAGAGPRPGGKPRPGGPPRTASAAPTAAPAAPPPTNPLKNPFE